MDKYSPKKHRFSSAIIYNNLEYYIKKCDTFKLSKSWYDCRNIWYYWHDLPTITNINNIKSTHMFLCEFVDFEKICRRVAKVDFNDVGIEHFFSIPLEEYFPEIKILIQRFEDEFVKLPLGVQKTEAWLYPIALDADADADIEAAIYFKSRNREVINGEAISNRWKSKIYSDIVKIEFKNKEDKDIIIAKAKDGSITLEESYILLQKSFSNRFFYCRDEEEDFIDISFLRAIEWFEINTFELWKNEIIDDISHVYQYCDNKIFSAWYLFYLCRSKIALQQSNRLGIESLLYYICTGSINGKAPWKQQWEIRSQKENKWETVDYIPLASIIVFAWEQIKPTNIDKSMYDNAIELIIKAQLQSGGWALTSHHSTSDILSTCFAIHALSLSKPKGWLKVVSKAKNNLLTQQNELGCWFIQGGPTVMINILCLDAISLATQEDTISFRITRGDTFKSEEPTSHKTLVFCEGDIRGKKNKNFDADCYKIIFLSEYPGTVFCSVGSCNSVESEDNDLFKSLTSLFTWEKVIKLVDRDDRSDEEVEELKRKGISTLSLRNIESYLMSDEIITKLCYIKGQSDKVDQCIQIKYDAIAGSVVRGNPSDDVKSAAGEIFTNIKKLLQLLRCGNDTYSFLRDTIVPLITEETVTYKKLKADIFGE